MSQENGSAVATGVGEGRTHALSEAARFTKHLLRARHWLTCCTHEKEQVATAQGLYSVGRSGH